MTVYHIHTYVYVYTRYITREPAGEARARTQLNVNPLSPLILLPMSQYYTTGGFPPSSDTVSSRLMSFHYNNRRGIMQFVCTRTRAIFIHSKETILLAAHESFCLKERYYIIISEYIIMMRYEVFFKNTAVLQVNTNKKDECASQKYCILYVIIAYNETSN